MPEPTVTDLEGREGINREERAAGSRADEILASDVFNDAFMALRDEWLDAFANTKIEDDKGRLVCWVALRDLGRLKANIVRVSRRGKLADKELDLLDNFRKDVTHAA